MNEFANVIEPSHVIRRDRLLTDAIVCCQAGLEWISMDDVGRYNFHPRYNFNVTAAFTCSRTFETRFRECLVKAKK